MALVGSGVASDQPSARLMVLVEDISMLMKCVALHNAPLLHQHSCRPMDSGALSARDQLPPPGFYSKILVSSISLTFHLHAQGHAWELGSGLNVG